MPLLFVVLSSCLCSSTSFLPKPRDDINRLNKLGEVADAVAVSTALGAVGAGVLGLKCLTAGFDISVREDKNL